jgi:hypothetical protein
MMHIFTKSDLDEFCEHFNKEYGKEISYKNYMKNPSVYHSAFTSYAKAYFTFYSERKTAKQIFSLDKVNEVENKKVQQPSEITKKIEELKESPRDSTWPCWSSNEEAYNGNVDYYFINKEWVDTQGIIKKDFIKTAILYDEDQSVTFVVQDGDCKWISKLVSLVDSMTVLKEYPEMYRVTSDKVNEYFNVRQFIDIEDAREKLNSYDLLHHLSKKRCEVELQIQSYLLRNYTMSNDGKKMMKSSILQERIETALLDSPIGNTPIIESTIADTLKFRKLISSVLLEMGLQKKRLSDGIYYYGIEPKITRELDMTSALETVIKEREQHRELILQRQHKNKPVIQ